MRFHPLGLLGLALLGLWCYFWFINLERNVLLGDPRDWWMPPWSFLGLDFYNNYFAALHWIDGGNVYFENFNDPIDRPYAYSPVVLMLFLWCAGVDPLPAYWVWTGVSVVIVFVAVVAVQRVRAALRLADLSVPFILALTLWSMPVIFAMERGNNDVLIILVIVFLARLLRRQSFAADLLIGALAAFAVWAKLYPLLLLPGLIVLGHIRAVAVAAIVGPLIGLAFLRDNLDWIEISRRVTANYPMSKLQYAHSISGSWPFLWHDLGVPLLARVPGLVGASIVLAPLAGWTSWQVWQCRQRLLLAYPYLLWLSACATFWFPVSMDYKLISLPLATLAVWRRQDHFIVHAFVGFMFLWWQPLALTIDPWLVLLCKLLGLVGVAMCIGARLRELSGEESPLAASRRANDDAQVDPGPAASLELPLAENSAERSA